MKKLLLHVATDFPDGVNNNSTRAVYNLLSATYSEFDHIVISVIRKSLFCGKVIKKNDFLYVVLVPKIPFGFFADITLLLSAFLFARKYRSVINDCYLVHAHKLTIDGVFGLLLSVILQKPLVVSVRGATDCKWIRFRFFSRFLYKIILDRASKIYWVSSWARQYIQKKLGMDLVVMKTKSVLLPNICLVDNAGPVDFKLSDKFLFVGRLDEVDWKGLYHLIDAFSDAGFARLDIVGRGSEKSKRNISDYIKSRSLCAQIRIVGEMGWDDLQKIYPNYAALLLPSYPETFGMTAVESLLNGTPVLIAKNSAIDGYLPNCASYIKKISFGDVAAISFCLRDLYDNQKIYKSQLIGAIANGDLDVFNTSKISNNYVNTIRSVG